MNKVKLILITSPLLLALMLLCVNPANASQVVTQPAIANNATAKQTQPIFEVVFEQPTLETPMLEFADGEANAAIQQYGCDCKGCLNAVLQLQGRLPLQ